MATAGPDKPYRDYAAFLRERYGESVYRVPVDLGLDCPNRANGRAGCAFCAETRARAAHLTPAMPPAEQVRRGIALARERYGATGFLAYFQAGTSTNAPAAELERMIGGVLDLAPFRGMVIATRPDCLPPAVLALLGRLAKQLDTWVELGVQSAEDRTLRRIDRGHTFAEAAAATHRLVEQGVHVVPHVILGLPGESRADLRRTAAALGRLPFAGIKIHNLHILEGTPLAAQWRRGAIATWDEHEYGEALMDFLRRIPGSWPILRLVTDSPAHSLLAPRWWLTKGQFVDYVEKQMRGRGWKQGDLAAGSRGDRPSPTADKEHPDKAGGRPKPKKRKKTQRLQRLSPTRDIAAHTLHALLAGVSLPPPRQSGHFVVLCVGFGRGPLALEAMHVLQTLHAGLIRMIALGAEAAFAPELRQRFPRETTLLETLDSSRSTHFDGGSIRIYRGDPRRYVFRIRGLADLVLLEPAEIGPDIQLYSLDFLRRITRLLQPDGVLVSAADAMPFRGALDRLGLYQENIPPDKTAPTVRGTLAAWSRETLTAPIGERDRAILRQTLSGIPYRDPPLTWSRKRIIQHRQAVLARMRERGRPKRLPSTSHE